MSCTLKAPAGTGTLLLALALAAVALLFIASLNVPIYGDSYGYSYRTARWMADNGLPLVPHGDSRGEQAMGHPALFFWLWALLMRVFGDTLAVARILPSMATLMSIVGTYLLGRRLTGSRMAGFLSATALLASPLFITQSLRPMPDSALVACVAWSLYFYVSGKYLPAAFTCFLAVIFREQAIFLAGAYFITEIFRSGIRKPGRLAVFASPILVILATVLLNRAVNGYYFYPTYLGESSTVLGDAWALGRFRFFAGHLLAEDFRWLLMVTALASSFSRDSETRMPLISILILLLPALFYPPGRIIYLLVVIGLFTWKFLLRNVMPSRTVLVMVLFPSMLVLFHVFIVAFSMDKALDLFRYLIGAYPVIIAGGVALLWRNLGSRAAMAAASVFVLATASANGTADHFLQPETSLACLRPLLSLKEAYGFASENADSVLVTPMTLDMIGNDALGYGVDSSRFRSPGGEGLSGDVTYSIVVSTFDLSEAALLRAQDMVPAGSRLCDSPLRTWDDGLWRTEVYLIVPAERRQI
jgi:4-amino-4-deoxy-L-arabinose transferase-like glycosyltransferase